MAVCDTFTFEGVTEDVFNRMKKRFESAGINVTKGDSGKILAKKFQANFTWDEKAGILSITFTKKGFLVPCNRLRKRIQRVLDNVRSD